MVSIIVIFLSNSSLVSTSNILLKYLESTYGKKVYIEIPHKEVDLKNVLTSNEFKVELDEGNGQYNLTRTFLITKK